MPVSFSLLSPSASHKVGHTAVLNWVGRIIYMREGRRLVIAQAGTAGAGRGGPGALALTSRWIKVVWKKVGQNFERVRGAGAEPSSIGFRGRLFRGGGHSHSPAGQLSPVGVWRGREGRRAESRRPGGASGPGGNPSSRRQRSSGWRQSASEVARWPGSRGPTEEWNKGAPEPGKLHRQRPRSVGRELWPWEEGSVV